MAHISGLRQAIHDLLNENNEPIPSSIHLMWMGETFTLSYCMLPVGNLPCRQNTMIGVAGYSQRQQSFGKKLTGWLYISRSITHTWIEIRPVLVPTEFRSMYGRLKLWYMHKTYPPPMTSNKFSLQAKGLAKTLQKQNKNNSSQNYMFMCLYVVIVFLSVRFPLASRPSGRGQRNRKFWEVFLIETQQEKTLFQ